MGCTRVDEPIMPIPLHNRPKILRLRRDGIPVELRARAQWINWELEYRNEAWTKTPKNARTGRNAAVDDPETWAPFAVASSKSDKLGFVLTGDDDFFFIDIDKARDPATGNISAWAEPFVDRLQDLTYGEFSPSGTGFKFIGRGRLPGDQHVKTMRDGGRIEFFAAKKYTTITGHRLEESPATLEDCQRVLDALYAEFWPEVETEPTPSSSNGKRPTCSDGDILELASNAENGAKFRRLFYDGSLVDYGDDESSADLGLLCMLAFYTKDQAQLERLFGRSALGQRGKWTDREDYRKRSLKKALELTTEQYAPHREPLLAGVSVEEFLRQWTNGQHEKDIPDQPEPQASNLSIDEFASYLPERKYIYRPTGKIWEPAGINRAFPPIKEGKTTIKQSDLIDESCPVHDLTWAPGEPQIIEGRFLDHGGWLAKSGARVYNSYRAPLPCRGDIDQADRWLDHLARVYPDDASHIVDWLAHQVQRPGEKLNHALVLGGAQGIGKDTILEPVRRAVGAWNCGEVSPTELLGRFNAFLKNVLLRVSELRDLGDRDRFGFYEHTKTLIAAPPDTVIIDEKNIRAYRVPNLVGVIFTTNHRTNGLYLPADDRRHFVAWSECIPEDFSSDYWTNLYRWFAEGGSDHVMAYLLAVDLATFDAKAPPPKTSAFWDIVTASRSPEDADLAEAIIKLEEPDALTVADVEQACQDLDFKAWIRDRKNSRQIPHRFEACGYVATRNPDAKDGQWVVNGKRQTVYAKQELSIQQRITAARKRTDRSW